MRLPRPHRRLTQRGLAWLRLVAAAAVATMLAGLPQSVAELYADQVDCCGHGRPECPGSDGEGHCPPDCTYGACAKTVGAMLQISAPVIGPAVSESTVAALEQSPVPSGVRVDVFHPPRHKTA